MFTIKILNYEKEILQYLKKHYVRYKPNICHEKLLIFFLFLSGISESTAQEPITFERTYSDSGVFEGRRIRQTFDGGYIVAGRRNVNATFFGDDGILLKTDSLGNMEWVKVYGTTIDEETKRGCAHAKALLDIAFSEYFPETIEWFDLNSSRMADEGNHSFENVMDKESAAMNIFNTDISSNEYKIYPNPFIDNLYISNEIVEQNKKAEIVFFDIMGKELLKVQLSSTNKIHEINTKILKEGIIFYVIILDELVIKSGKLLHLNNN